MLFWLKMQLYPPKRPLRDAFLAENPMVSARKALRDDFLTFEMSKNMFPGIFFGFDICNLKLFPIKNRSSIVPSLENIQNIKFLMF